MNTDKTVQVLIIIRGGVLQNVFSADPDLKIDVLDFDNEDFNTDEQANIELERRKFNLNQVI